MALVDHRTYLADVLARQAARRRAVDPHHNYPRQPVLSHQREPYPEAGPSETAKGKGIPEPAASKDNVINYIHAEEAVRNDYAAWYGVSGSFPSNFVLGAGDDEICEEFPALRRLMDLKAEHVAAVAHPPLYAPLGMATPSAISAALAPHRFDVILIHPPRSWAEAAQLPIRQLNADPGFVFLWVGSSDAGGLERGRECLAKWGFRRAEDIVWVKTNKRSHAANGGGLFASQKEHCLMGIRGTVRRSTDSRFVHCNVDTDVIVWEGEEGGPRTPPYLYTLIENFCLGSRRLELFGNAETARRGWVTVATAPTPDGVQVFDGATYPSLLPTKEEGKPVLPFHPEIDMLRPKSPQRRGGRRMQSAAASPPPSHTPPFRPPGGVMRMGSLTPAQGYAPNPMFQQGMMNSNIGMGVNMNIPQGHGHAHPHPHAHAHPHGHGAPAPNQAMAQGMNMMGGMPMYQGMGMVPGMMMGGPMGMQMPMEMQMNAMGMGMMGGMGMMRGMVPMNMGMPMGMGMGGMGAGVGMGTGMGMGSVHGTPPVDSRMEDEEWAAQHGRAMGQLALGMNTMGMPYLGGGYQYNG